MANQIKFSFDAITRSKIFKGALIALTGSAALGLLGFFGALQINNPALAMFAAWFIPFAVNVVKEWMAGQQNTNS
jgi:hypothetical protein